MGAVVKSGGATHPAVAKAAAAHAAGVKPSITQYANMGAENPNAYNVNVPGMSEAITQPLYDIQSYPAAGQTTFTFFAVPVGQSSKTLADTNMTIAGAIPEPQQFRVEEICIEWFPGATAAPMVAYGAGAATGAVNDMYAVFRAGYLQFNIGSKNYLNIAPLSKLPPRSVFDAHGAASDSSTAAASQQWRMQVPFIRGPMFKIRPFLLPAMQNWTVTLNFPTAVALPSSDALARIGVTLWGTQYRSVQ